MNKKFIPTIIFFIFLISTNFLSAQSCSVNAGVSFETDTKTESVLTGAISKNAKLSTVYWESDAAFPSSIVFENIQSPVSKVTFLLPGIYTLFLNARCEDDILAVDKIQVIVKN